MHIRSLLSQRIEAAFTTLGLSGQALLQAASRPEFGDYQANGVMAAAKRAGKNPREVAQAGGCVRARARATANHVDRLRAIKHDQVRVRRLQMRLQMACPRRHHHGPKV